MKPYLIAEIGVNFYDTAKILNISLLDAAKLYIDKAAEAGVNCAKFQSYKAETIVSKNSPVYWDNSEEDFDTQYELFKATDHFGEKEYRILCDYAHEKGMDFTSTPFDYESADYLESFVDFYKISSSDVTNIPFIEYIGAKGKPVCISAGASYLSEIDDAIRALKRVGCKDIVVFHCMLAYPTDYEDANLEVIRTLKRIYPDIHIGYSDHTFADSTMTVLTTAYLLGAEVIEKHYTLDKTVKGNDHEHAAEPADFKKAVENFELIEKIMGSGEKDVFPCEELSRKYARRSLVLARDMKKGEVICASDFSAKRPGTGIPPTLAESVIGRTLCVDCPEDTILDWSMLS